MTIKRPYKGYKKTIYEFLVKYTKFRERQYKNKGIAYLLHEKFPQIREIPSDKLIKVLVAYASMNRWWSRILQDFHPELRGKDYNDKYILRQERQQELGYEFGFYQNKKLLEKIAPYETDKSTQTRSDTGIEEEIRITPSENNQSQLEKEWEDTLSKSDGEENNIQS